MSTRFEANLRNQLSDDEIGHECQEFPDLYHYVRTRIFRAAVEWACGSYLLSLSLIFVDDLWEFHHHILNFFKGFSLILMPKAFSAQEKCLQAVQKWHRFANEYQQGALSERGEDVDAVFGTKHFRERQDFFFENGTQECGRYCLCGSGIDMGVSTCSAFEPRPSTST